MSDSPNIEQDPAGELAAARRRIVDLEEQLTSRSSDLTLWQLETAVRTMQIGVTVTDTSGKIVYVNAADAEMHGYTPEELIGQHARIFAPAGSGKPISNTELRSMESWQRESFNVRKDGTTFPVHLTSDVVRDVHGEPLGVVTSCQDITDRRESEAALRRSEERYALAAAGSNDGLWDWDLLNDELFLSPRWKSMLGYAEHEIGSTPSDWLDRIVPGDRARVNAAIDTHLQDGTSHLQSEYRMTHKDGSPRWMLCRGLAVRDENGRPYRMAGSQTDITERRIAEQQLVYDAFHDSLTGLPNRELFKNLVEHSLERRKGGRADYSFAILMLDLDRFQVVNDSLGHAVGDELIVAITRRLKMCTRPGDTLARLGGDEFGILLQDVSNITDATAFANRIYEQLSGAFTLNGMRVFPSASIGIVLAEERYDDPAEILRDADTALYRAKSGGKARHEIFVPAMRDRAVERLRLETDLRMALEKHEFIAHYQPIVNIADSTLAGFEALMRWQHSTRGVLPPRDFIPTAEETGLIVPMGWWILVEACRQMSAWIATHAPDPPLTLSVNLSAKQFMAPDIVAQVRSAVEETGFAPELLHLELTETDIMQSTELGYPTLGELKNLNVKVHMDDFGTGYSSLSNLTQFPIDALKIDRSFIKDLGNRSDDPEIVRNIIGLAQDLGLPVVAEGVEEKRHLDRLRELHCEYAQGYYFAKPMNPQAAEKLIQLGAPLPAQSDHDPAEQPRNKSIVIL